MADLRRLLVGEQGTATIDAILQRAAARGEVDLTRITPRMASLPFDLFRSEALMAIVFLPLVPRP